MVFEIILDGTSHRVELKRLEPNQLQVSRESRRWSCLLDGRAVEVDAVLTRPDVLSLLIEGKSYEIKRERVGTDVHFWVGARRYAAEVLDPRSLRNRRGRSTSDGPQKLVALMPGKVVRVLLAEQATVEAGQGVLVVEAMKMQNEIKSPKQGKIAKIVASEGARVNAGDVLAIIE
jgi:biotin carboxyl carrier protein